MIVYFDDGTPTNDFHVTHYEGQQSNKGPLLFSFPLEYTGGRVEARMHVSDGELIFSDGDFPWQTIPGMPQTAFTPLTIRRLYDGLAPWSGRSVPRMGHGRSGEGLWDIQTMVLTPMYGPTGHYLTSVNYAGGSDCVSLQVAQIVQAHGVRPAALSPNPVNFGDVVVGQTTPVQRFTLTNLQPAAITLHDPVLTPGHDFAIVGQTCSGGQTLAVNATCTIDVQFAPTHVILPRETALRVDFNDVATLGATIAYYATLRSAGVSSEQFSRLQSEPLVFRFPDTSIGTTSAAKQFQGQNTGNLPLVISNVALAGPNAGLRFTLTGSNCNGQTLAPGTSCTADVVFHPPGLVLYTSAYLAVDYSASDMPANTVASTLSGRGVAAPDYLFADGFEGAMRVE